VALFTNVVFPRDFILNGHPNTELAPTI
jgi:hypothetical protein